MSHFEGHFEGAKTFLTPHIVPSAARDNLGVKKVEAPSKCPEHFIVQCTYIFPTKKEKKLHVFQKFIFKIILKHTLNITALSVE